MRNRTPLAGSHEVKPREEKYFWYLADPSEPNTMEVLFYACLCCVAANSVGELQEWASKVYSYQAAAETAGPAWQPPPGDWSVTNGVPALFVRMESAFKGVRNIDHLGKIAAAMRHWDGDGRVDCLDGKKLSNYMHRQDEEEAEGPASLAFMVHRVRGGAHPPPRLRPPKGAQA